MRQEFHAKTQRRKESRKADPGGDTFEELYTSRLTLRSSLRLCVFACNFFLVFLLLAIPAHAQFKPADYARTEAMIPMRDGVKLYTTIDAPFDAVLQDRSVEIGDYVQSGDAVAFVVDTDPMIVVGEVNEREVHSLAVGNPGTARLVDNTTVEGTIRYLAPVADENTRTFRVELAVPNPDGTLRAGMTAELKLSA